MVKAADKLAYVCFESFDKIAASPAYRPDNPLTVENYRRILGWYRLPERQACCVQRLGGSLCHQLHLNGFVAELNDGSITILGGDCANDKFGADSSVFKDIGLARNAMLQKARDDRISVLVGQTAQYQARLSEAVLLLKDGQSRIQAFISGIGEVFKNRLENMARTGNATVVVEGVKIRHYQEDGRNKEERSTIRENLGAIAGLAAIDRSQFVALIIELQELKAAFADAAELPTISRKRRNEISVRLEQCDPALVRAERLREDTRRFLGNSAWLYCFLTDDRSERTRLARLAMRERGVEGSRESAKAWLLERERKLASELRVDHLRILR